MPWFKVLRPRYRVVYRRVTLKGRRAHYLRHKERARALAQSLVRHYARAYNVPVKRVCIKNLKTRWGSASKNGNLNFHYKLALLPDHLANYLIVHEVCHLKEFNHSPKFWSLVGQQLPDYKKLRKELLSTK
jgi:predicted metal-dependent hydrolase